MVLRRSLMALIAMIAAVMVHFWLIGLADRVVGVFPSVKDVVLLNLPLISVGYLGEVWFVLFLLLFAWRHFRYQAARTPTLFYAIALLYILRGILLLVFPIGAPVGAPTDAVTVYPYPNHSYFPGGHVGLMMLLALATADRRWRLIFIVGAVLFGFGTMLTRAHYTADTIVGIINAYAVASILGLAPTLGRRL